MHPLRAKPLIANLLAVFCLVAMASCASRRSVPTLPPIGAARPIPMPGPIGPEPQQAPAAAQITLRKIGPTQASVGATVTYRIEVSNPGGAAATGVTVSDQLTPGLAFVSSTPEATIDAGQLAWQLGDLAPRETRSIDLHFRAEQAGIFSNCAVARTADGQSSQDCASTMVMAAELEVSVTAPQQAIVGESVTFRITVRNRGRITATGLMVKDQFDPGLQHELPSPIETDLGELAPGQSLVKGVTFHVSAPGRLCNRVEVTADGGLRGSAEACVTATAAPVGPAQTPAQPPPPADAPQSPTAPDQAATPPRPGISVRQIAPELAEAGGVAEFLVEIVNDGELPLTEVTVTNSFDPRLVPVQATGNHEWVNDSLVWKLPGLEVGRTARLQLHFRATDVAARACNRVRVTTRQGASAEDETCLEIRRTPSQLSLSVADLADPVAVGKELTYDVRVTNGGAAPARNVALVVILPPSLSLVDLGTRGPTSHGLDGQNLRFEPVAEIAPGSTVTFKIRARAEEPGEARLQARVGSEGLATPLTQEETTLIFSNR